MYIRGYILCVCIGVSTFSFIYTSSIRGLPPPNLSLYFVLIIEILSEVTNVLYTRFYTSSISMFKIPIDFQIAFPLWSVLLVHVSRTLIYSGPYTLLFLSHPTLSLSLTLLQCVHCFKRTLIRLSFVSFTDILYGGIVVFFFFLLLFL